MTPTLDNSLTLRQEQRQILSPAQIQSLELLTLPIQDLATYINEQLLENPMLEASEEQREAPEEGANIAVAEEAAPQPPDSGDFWTDGHGSYYAEDYSSHIAISGDHNETDYTVEDNSYDNDDEGLRSHLLLQLSLLRLEAAEERAAKTIIFALDEDGYLRLELDDLAETMGIPQRLMANALTRVQGLDPPGVGARSLVECLCLQLPANHPDYQLIRAVIENHLHDLAARRIRNVARAYNVSEHQVEEAFDFVRSLNPRPVAAPTGRERIHYIVPDIIVRKVDGEYRILLNDRFHPRLRISSYYRQFSGKEMENEEVKEYVRQKIGSAMLLIRNIERRHDTIYRLAEIVVRHQLGFLEHGLSYLKPLTLREVAEQAELHESTVSRAVCGKYVETPRGVYSWKFFFPRAYIGEDGSVAAEPYVKKLIATMIAEENQTSPLSDRQIEEELCKRGIAIARRTVAKYRAEIGLPRQSYRRRPAAKG